MQLSQKLGKLQEGATEKIPDRSYNSTIRGTENTSLQRKKETLTIKDVLAKHYFIEPIKCHFADLFCKEESFVTFLECFFLAKKDQQIKGVPA